MKKVSGILYYLVSAIVLFGAAIKTEETKIGHRVYLGEEKMLAETIGIFIGMVLCSLGIAWVIRKFAEIFTKKSFALTFLYIAVVMAFLFYFLVPTPMFQKLEKMIF